MPAMSSKLSNTVSSYFNLKLRKDFIAALTVSVVLIPQSMAYAILAGLPPVYGLYAALVPLIIYGIFGSSSDLSIGPVALISIIVFGGISGLAELGSQNYLDLVLLAGLMAGLLQLIYYFLKLGDFADYLSAPLLSGFISAAGVIIIISQIKSLFTIPIEGVKSTPEVFYETMINLSNTNWYSLIFGAGAMLLIFIFDRINKEIPGALLVVVLSSLIMYLLGTYETKVPTVGDLPMGLPAFYAGFIKSDNILKLLPTAGILSIVCFVGSISIAKSLATTGSKINSNRELLALGLAKVVSSFFLSMPSSSSFSRSAINHNAGSQSGMSSIFAAFVLAIVVSFFGSLFFYLPMPVLAAIIIMSVLGLIDVDEAKEFWRINKRDFSVFLFTFISTIVFGIISGIIIGLIISLLFQLLKRSRKNAESPY